MPIRVLIADDHPIIRDGLTMIIHSQSDDIKVLAQAGTGREVLEYPHLSSIDVFVLDITMPELNGLEAARRILQQNPDAKVIILSLHESKQLVDQALDYGVKGYLLKESATGDIIEAIRQVHAGHSFLSPRIMGQVVEEYRKRKRKEGPEEPGEALTPRETEVLQLIAEGLSTKEIAAKLGLAVNTVRVHRSNLMSKLGLHKAQDLVRYAIKRGIAKL
jgi:DNA-binding NarL/FixJ family response regulator